MAHGGYGKRRVKPAGRRSKSLGTEKKKPKLVSLKNQIRSVERMLLRKVFFFFLINILQLCFWFHSMALFGARVWSLA